MHDMCSMSASITRQRNGRFSLNKTLLHKSKSNPNFIYHRPTNHPRMHHASNSSLLLWFSVKLILYLLIFAILGLTVRIPIINATHGFLSFLFSFSPTNYFSIFSLLSHSHTHTPRCLSSAMRLWATADFGLLSTASKEKNGETSSRKMLSRTLVWHTHLLCYVLCFSLLWFFNFLGRQQWGQSFGHQKSWSNWHFEF